MALRRTDRPLDRGAIARPINHEARRIRRRMEERQRRALDRDDDRDDGMLLRSIMPSRSQLLFGCPEPLKRSRIAGSLLFIDEPGGAITGSTASGLRSSPEATVPLFANNLSARGCFREFDDQRT